MKIMLYFFRSPHTIGIFGSSTLIDTSKLENIVAVAVVETINDGSVVIGFRVISEDIFLLITSRTNSNEDPLIIAKILTLDNPSIFSPPTSSNQMVIG